MEIQLLGIAIILFGISLQIISNGFYLGFIISCVGLLIVILATDTKKDKNKKEE